jgi:hypothetical protein
VDSLKSLNIWEQTTSLALIKISFEKKFYFKYFTPWGTLQKLILVELINSDLLVLKSNSLLERISL